MNSTARRNRTPLVAAVIAALVAVGVAAAALVVVTRSGGGGSHPTRTASGAPARAATTTTVAHGPAPTKSATRPATSPTTYRSSSPTTAPPTAVNDTAGQSTKDALASAYVAANNGLDATDVDGTVPGSVYYATDTDTGTSYAVASIQPSASYTAQFGEASQAFNNGPYAFTEAQGGGWTYSGALGSTSACPSFPSAVLAVWAMSPGACNFSSGS